MNLEESRRRWEEAEDIFTTEDFDCLLPLLREELSSIGPNNEKMWLIRDLTDEDYLELYAEWFYQKKSTRDSDRNGFAFEVLCRRYLNKAQPQKELGKRVGSIILFLGADYNNFQLWSEPRVTPDDLEIIETRSSLVITKIYEAKISIHALQRSTRQRRKSRHAMSELARVLGGYDQDKILPSGLSIIENSRKELRRLSRKPLILSDDCRYIYLLPWDHRYQVSPKESYVEVINVPITSSQLDQFSRRTIHFFGENFGWNI